MGTAVIQPPLTMSQSAAGAQLVQFGEVYAVCSLHFKTFEVSRDFRAQRDETYNHKYTIQGVEKIDDPPTILYVQDALQRNYMGRDKTPMYQDATIVARDIARDLVRVACGGEVTGPDTIQPAVWIAAAKNIPKTAADYKTWGTPEFAKQFPDFAAEAEARKQQEWAWCDSKVKNADSWFAKGLVLEINDLHRDSAKFIKANQAEHQWIAKTTYGLTVPCPFCGVATASTAPKCQNCKEVINPSAYKALKAQIEAASK
jgi:hypothetical protein